jgi:type VI secretion system protein ImpF
VTVSLEPVERGDRVLRFRIDARLRIEPAPEPVSFDMMLQLDRGDYVVRSG